MKVSDGYAIREIETEMRNGLLVLKILWDTPNPPVGVSGKWTAGVINNPDADSINLMLEDMKHMVTLGG